jgi:hypothetical protein
MLRKTFRVITGFDLPQKDTPAPVKRTHKSKISRTELIRKEAKLGGTLFGEVPAGHHREFFCLDKHTWIWFEEWFDSEAGRTRHINVRYDVQPHGVLKTVDGEVKGYVTGDELSHLLAAARTYYQRAATEIYGRQFATA